jgi:hypothetical protein
MAMSPAAPNASLVSAYYLAAAQGKQIDELLENVVILFDPSFNPDGLQRFSTWVNQHKSNTLVTDPDSREFNEVWPGGRFNHYWFDLNRDWLPLVHVESRNRLQWFHKWKPNILTDHHEQNSNATFFFQPGVPSRVNPLTPLKNQELTTRLAAFHAAFWIALGRCISRKRTTMTSIMAKVLPIPISMAPSAFCLNRHLRADMHNKPSMACCVFRLP